MADRPEEEYISCVRRILSNYLDYLESKYLHSVDPPPMIIPEWGDDEFCVAVAAEYGDGDIGEQVNRDRGRARHELDVTILGEWDERLYPIIEEFGKFASSLNYGCTLDIAVHAEVATVKIT